MSQVLSSWGGQGTNMSSDSDSCEEVKAPAGSHGSFKVERAFDVKDYSGFMQNQTTQLPRPSGSSAPTSGYAGIPD